MSNIKKRILQHIEVKRITENQFCKKSGFTPGILKRNTGISEDNILKFINFFPDVDVNWLITGNKKGYNQGKKGEIAAFDKPEGDGKQMNVAGNSEIISFKSELKSLTKTIRKLKKDLKSQKKILETITKKIDFSGVEEN